MNRWWWTFAIVAAVLVGTSCSEEGTGGVPQAGTLVVRLATPHADDGALLFEVAGPPIDSATAANAALRLFTRRDNNGNVVGAVVGTLGTGAMVTLYVPDIGAAAAYVARVIEVADRGHALRPSLAGYALSVTP